MTTTPYCTVCRDNPLTGTRATFTVCQPCVDRIDQLLDQVEQLWPRLPDFLERGRGHSGPRVSGDTKTSGGIPPAEDVLDLIGPGGIPDRLSEWDVWIRGQRGLPAAPAMGSADHRFSTALRGLRNHLAWAAANLDLRSLDTALRNMTGAMRAATGDRDEPTTTELGTLCSALTDIAECGAVLRYDKTTRAVHCDNGHHLNTAWHLRLAAA
ncbi:hypothetical protein [Streptomyces sp. sk226]|uniref:hypothetical protein n=1 Tax=Streptomyces sp. sk226 TaxID=2034268 RepID=UPI000BEFDC43|nr:hypothetical protein [Streptomyces sp. sk226]